MTAPTTPTTARPVSGVRRSVAALLAAAVTLPVSACATGSSPAGPGTLPAALLATQVMAQLSAAGGPAPDGVQCAGPIVLQVGASQECTVVVGLTQHQVLVSVHELGAGQPTFTIQ